MPLPMNMIVPIYGRHISSKLKFKLLKNNIFRSIFFFFHSSSVIRNIDVYCSSQDSIWTIDVCERDSFTGGMWGGGLDVWKKWESGTPSRNFLSRIVVFRPPRFVRVQFLPVLDISKKKKRNPVRRCSILRDHSTIKCFRFSRGTLASLLELHGVWRWQIYLFLTVLRRPGRWWPKL